MMLIPTQLILTKLQHNDYIEVTVVRQRPLQSKSRHHTLDHHAHEWMSLDLIARVRISLDEVRSDETSLNTEYTMSHGRPHNASRHSTQIIALCTAVMFRKRAL